MAVLLDKLEVLPDAKGIEIVDAFCEEHHYEGDDTLAAKRAYMRAFIIEFIRRPWLTKKKRLARQAADATVDTEAGSVTIT